MQFIPTNEDRFKEYPEILTVQEVSDIFGIGKSQVYELAKRKGFPRLPFKKPIRIPKRELIVWIQKTCSYEI